jgi:hypothetical protein
MADEEGRVEGESRPDLLYPEATERGVNVMTAARRGRGEIRQPDTQWASENL